MFIALEILSEFSQQARSGRIPPDPDRPGAESPAADERADSPQDTAVEAWACHAAGANGFGG